MKCTKSENISNRTFVLNQQISKNEVEDGEK